MKFKSGLQHIRTKNIGTIVESAKLQGWKVLQLDCIKVVDRASFFDCARKSLPMDPPLAGNKSWDAFSDSLWGGIDLITDNKILILWSDSGSMYREAHSDYEIAEEIFKDLVKSLGCSKDTDDEVKEVCVIIT